MEMSELVESKALRLSALRTVKASGNHIAEKGAAARTVNERVDAARLLFPATSRSYAKPVCGRERREVTVGPTILSS
jgi:hypothetical protein